MDNPTLTFHDHVAYPQGLRMVEFLYGESIVSATIQQTPLADIHADKEHGKPAHEWEFCIVFDGDEEPTWFILKAWPGVRYATWRLYQDGYLETTMLMSVKLRTRR